MKKHIFAVGLLFALAGCDIGGIRGNGHLITEQRKVDPFINIETGGAFRVEWHSGAQLTSNALEGASFSGASRLNAHQLSGTKFYLETTGASNVVLDGAVDELVANMTGASDLRAESLQTKMAELSVTGAGDARVAVSD
ncbi:MAG: hypothetical protein DME40_03265, partial [Verrucomicrobia bacterium]